MNTDNLVLSIGQLFARVKQLTENVDAASLNGMTVQDILNAVTGDGGPFQLLSDDLTAFTERTDNPHGVTKLQVGLGNVADFGMATAETVLQTDNASAYVSPELLWTALSNFWADKVGTSPETLDTIQEIAEAFQNNPDIIQTIQDGLATKVSAEELALEIQGVTDQITALAATVEQIEAGTANDVFVTPLGLKSVTDGIATVMQANTDALTLAFEQALEELQDSGEEPSGETYEDGQLPS